MRLTAAAVLFTLVVAGGGPVRLGAQSAATFKSAVNLVPISASVRDHRGRLVTTLAAADFEVFDKGERRRIVDFQVDTAGAVSVAVLLDVSGSMRIGPKLALAREVMKALAGSLHDGSDEIGLFTFASELQAEQPFTIHAAQLENAVDAAEPFGTTSLYDAIAQTARQLALRDAPRRAILVVTDGLDNSSQLAPSEVSAIASSIDVPVYVIVAVPPIDHVQYLQRDAVKPVAPTGDLRDLAWWTGGDLVWVDAAKDAVVRVKEVLSELRHQYLIAIESSDAPEWRPLDVRVRRRNLTVRARSGYFARETGSK